jgi:hypothetical protein
MDYIKSYKIFESIGYDNIEINRDEYFDLGSHKPYLDFTDKEFNILRRFFAQYNTKIVKTQNERFIFGEPQNGEKVIGTGYYGKDCLIVVSPRNCYINIYKLEDEWYKVYFSNFNGLNTDHKDKYFKCDQMGGLIEILTKLMEGTKVKKVDPDEYISAQDSRKKVASLKDKLIKKIRTLGMEDLEKLSNQLLKESLILESKYENQIITEEDWVENWDKHRKNNFVLFTQKELDKIKNYFLTLNIPKGTFKDKIRFIKDNPRKKTWEEGYDIKDINLVLLNDIHHTRTKFSGFQIIKTDDDWFLVNRIMFNPSDEEYYKCDSMDGLIEYLKPLTTYYGNKDLALLKSEVIKKINKMSYDDLVKLNSSI